MKVSVQDILKWMTTTSCVPYIHSYMLVLQVSSCKKGAVPAFTPTPLATVLDTVSTRSNPIVPYNLSNDVGYAKHTKQPDGALQP